MSQEPIPPESAQEALDRLSEKGTRILDLCLELRKDLCVKGFVDAQLEFGPERLVVLDAMRHHVIRLLSAAPSGARRRQLESIRDYITERLESATAPAELPSS